MSLSVAPRTEQVRECFTPKELLTAVGSLGHTSGKPHEMEEREQLIGDAWQIYLARTSNAPSHMCIHPHQRCFIALELLTAVGQLGQTSGRPEERFVRNGLIKRAWRSELRATA